MNKTQLIAGLRAHLADKEDIANEAAPALALMRYAVVELEKPTSSGGHDEVEVANLRRDLASSEKYVGELFDALNDREGTLYSLLADLGMVPEVDDEPVNSLAEALELAPNLLDELQTKVANLYANSDDGDDDKDRFIDGVRKLLDGESLSLQGLWELLESKAQYLDGLEKGIGERDQKIAEADRHTSTLNQIIASAFDASGIPPYEPVHKLGEYIRQVVQQRDQANKEIASRFEAPAEDTLEAILEEVITIMRLDWQDVETLPQEIQKLRDDANAMLKAQTFAVSDGVPMAGWVSDAVDLAHAVRGNLAPENRVMAKAAEAIILSAPGRS